jgi:hypothetical protein
MQNKTCANLKSLFKAGQSQTHQGLPDSRPNGWWSHIGIAKMVRLGYLRILRWISAHLRYPLI